MATIVLNKFKDNTDHELLKSLIDVYSELLSVSEDEQVNGLVEKLKTIFEEKSNANHSA